MTYLVRLVLFVGTAVAMEPLSALIHRRFGHGKGWFLHRSHHVTLAQGLELNDVIPALSALITMLAFTAGVSVPALGWLLPLAAGATLYGMLYFLVHDVYIHRRLPLLPATLSWLEPFKVAHMTHHETGTGSWGIFSRPRTIQTAPVEPR